MTAIDLSGKIALVSGVGDNQSFAWYISKTLQAAGAKIIRPLQDTPYGSREFAVVDPEGHSWSLGTYDPWKVQS